MDRVIEELEENVEKYFITIEKYFKNYKSINLNEKKLQLFLNGVQLTYKLEDGIYNIYVKVNNLFNTFHIITLKLYYVNLKILPKGFFINFFLL